MNPAQQTLAPSDSARDSDGRLIKLIFDSSPALSAADTNPWLIAVDKSDNALRALAHAAAQAEKMTACALHLLHVHAWLSREAAETELAQHALKATARARELLDASGLPWRLHVTMGEPAECILAHAADLHATNIIIGSRGLNMAESLLFGSVTNKVMHLSPVPVTVVP